MAAKMLGSGSSCASRRFAAVIISCMTMVFLAFLAQCDARSRDIIAPIINTDRVALQATSDSEAQAKMMIPEHAWDQGALEHVAKLLCIYTITTTTGKKWGAGTDSTISIRLYNNASQTVYFPSLDNANNNFEKGKADKFLETGDCVSHICKVAVYTDNSGFMPAWFVESVGVSVATPAAGIESTTWQLHEWLPRTDSTSEFFALRDNCV